ncbi:hypothetical protein SEVIR_3G143800v4 [Setaria viridis]|uniref:DUF1645 domain-containing protein n=2 Tax=Setaria TaxID=4554 RepID=K3ZDF2_SETIT|nr:uncharacterized protein LOC101757654 [Setaria italica]XP_034584796.1 uncharacterized protein LOC117847661 [Setaria viridis]RCV16476.1 hypothetical protein SETIT_3G141400v2 [Setaria italica]TKW25812.1 hypothetical protein SEVIR_3G143800v2 [Setaria viridis]
MDGDDFTFAAVPPPLLAAGGGGGGRMGPLYPVFGRPRSPPRPAPEPVTATARVPLGRLLLVDREPTPAEDGDLDSVPAEMYCPWSPGWAAAAASPARCKKSGSTGSVLRWRPRLVGRSQSDGKEKFVFLSTSASGRKGRTGGGDGGVAAALGGHAWSHYAKGGGNGGARRRSFLPYKQDLVGLFANTAVFRRSYHPF